MSPRLLSKYTSVQLGMEIRFEFQAQKKQSIIIGHRVLEFRWSYNLRLSEKWLSYCDTSLYYKKGINIVATEITSNFLKCKDIIYIDNIDDCPEVL